MVKTAAPFSSLNVGYESNQGFFGETKCFVDWPTNVEIFYDIDYMQFNHNMWLIEKLCNCTLQIFTTHIIIDGCTCLLQGD